MIDRMANTTAQDLAFANAMGMDIKEVERLDIFKQKNQMQNLAFTMQTENKVITQEEADELNQRYNEITYILEREYDKDLSGDYWIDFNCFVPENTKYKRFAY